MHSIKIDDKEYELRFTIESWKKLKEKIGITPGNIQEKLNEDFAGAISHIIYYGIVPDLRNNVTLEKLDSSFGFEVMDIVMPAIVASMPKSTQSSEGSSAEKK